MVPLSHDARAILLDLVGMDAFLSVSAGKRHFTFGRSTHSGEPLDQRQSGACRCIIYAHHQGQR